MLQSRLTPLALTVGALTLLAACGGGDGGGAIEDNVVRPGITAMENAQVLACDANLAGLEQAIESYTMLEGSAPPDQAALVEAQYLREPVDGWDITDGRIVATDPQCGEVGAVPENAVVPATAPATTIGQIVTEDSVAPITPQEILASFSDDDIAAMGGQECADELAVISAASQQYSITEGRDPLTIQDLVDAGYLTSTPGRWTVVDDELVGTPESGCTLPGGEVPDAASSCQAEARTLQVALEAYVVSNPGAPSPSAAELVEAGLLREEPGGVWIVDGRIVPVIGSPCESADLGL